MNEQMSLQVLLCATSRISGVPVIYSIHIHWHIVAVKDNYTSSPGFIPVSGHDLSSSGHVP